MDLGKDLMLEMYRSMQRIRQFEGRVRDLAIANELPGFVHVSIGEEASATGVCAALRKTDRITSTHRGHSHLIAKGGRLDRMMAELYGKREGYCKGKGGSMRERPTRERRSAVGASVPAARECSAAVRTVLLGGAMAHHI